MKKILTTLLLSLATISVFGCTAEPTLTEPSDEFDLGLSNAVTELQLLDQ